VPGYERCLRNRADRGGLYEGGDPDVRRGPAVRRRLEGGGDHGFVARTLRRGNKHERPRGGLLVRDRRWAGGPRPQRHRRQGGVGRHAGSVHAKSEPGDAPAGGRHLHPGEFQEGLRARDDWREDGLRDAEEGPTGEVLWRLTFRDGDGGGRVGVGGQEELRGGDSPESTDGGASREGEESGRQEPRRDESAQDRDKADREGERLREGESRQHAGNRGGEGGDWDALRRHPRQRGPYGERRGTPTRFTLRGGGSSRRERDRARPCRGQGGERV